MRIERNEVKTWANIKHDLLVKLNPVEAKTTKSNESDNFLPVAREADLSTGPT